MEIKGFIEKFSMQFEDLSTGLEAKTRFRDVEGWSSLVGFSIIAMLDEEYSVKIKAADITNSQTIEDLFLIVKSRI